MAAIVVWIISSVIIAGAFVVLGTATYLNRRIDEAKSRIYEAELRFAKTYSEHDVYVEDYLRHLENIDRLLRRCDICKAK